MHFRFQRFLRNLKVIGPVASNTIQLILALIGFSITTSAGAILLSLFLHLQNWVTPLITFVSGIILTLSWVIFFASRVSPPRWLLRGYRHNKWETQYKIDENDPKQHTFRVKVEIEATQLGVHLFEDTYQWTGRGKEGVPQVISPGHTLVGEVRRRSGWKYYYIDLGQDLNVGERTVVEVIQELYDSDNEFQPFLAKIISQPIDLLVLHVIVPRKKLPSNIIFTEYNTVGPASGVIRNMNGTVSQNGDIHWEIKRPIFGHRYEISWG